MSNPTVEQIKAMAMKATFYSAVDGLMYRMNFCEDDYFVYEDEDTGEEYEIEYSDVTFKGFESFYTLVQMDVPT